MMPADTAMNAAARALGLALLASALGVPCLASMEGDGAPGFGVTPNGRIWRSDGKEITLFSPEGDEHARHRLRTDEKSILSVADDGSRVTSPWRLGVRRSGGFGSQTSRARLVFRDAGGNPLRTADLDGLVAELGFRGNEVYGLSREGAELVLRRTSSAEERATVLRIARKKILAETGKVEALQVHASGPGILVEVRGPYRSAFVDTAGAILLPDPAADCGQWEASGLAFPGRAGSLYRSRRSWSEGRAPELRLEHVTRDGGLASSVRIPLQGKIHPLAGSGFLVVTDAEVVVFDEQAVEQGRSPLPSQGGPSKEAARRLAVARRRFQPDAKPTGADWVELALASTAVPEQEILATRGDLDGALARLLEVPDGHPDAERAAAVLGTLVSMVPYLELMRGDPTDREIEVKARESTAALAKRLDAIGAGAPLWFRTATARWVVGLRGADAGAWAVDAILAAAAKGEVDAVPESLMTRELAEKIGILDRERLDALDRAGTATPRDMDMLATFRVPAGRYPDIVFDCLPGSGPIRFRAAVGSLSRSGAAVGSNVAADAGEDYDPRIEGVAAEAGGSSPERDAAEAAAAAAASLHAAERLAWAAGSTAPELQAAAQLLAPYNAAPLDAAVFRRHVVSRPEAADLAIEALLADRSLGADAWRGLFSAVLLSARGRSANPTGCVEAFASMEQGDEEQSVDSYCALLRRATQGGGGFTPYGMHGRFAAEGSAAPSRDADLEALTRAASAPPELRLLAKMGRAMRGQGTARDLVELWDERELPRELRTTLLQTLSYGDEKSAQLAELAPELLRRIREGGLASDDETTLASVVARVSPAEIGRIATERLLTRRLDLADAAAADVWLTPIQTGAIASAPELRQALKALLADENAGPRAAALLAKAGEPEAIPRLVFGLRTGCFH